MIFSGKLFCPSVARAGRRFWSLKNTNINTNRFRKFCWRGFLAVTGVLADVAIALPDENQANGLSPRHVAVIVNDADIQSVQVANYYKKRRAIPAENIIHVNFPPGRSTLNRSEFRQIKLRVDKTTPAHVQTYALTWTRPYRVDCMSITTAFAAGFDEAYCSRICGPTKPSPYFNSNSRRPYVDYGLRPAIALAGRNIEEVKKLIDRGIASDGTFPRATGFLLSTSDKNRNVRAPTYADIIRKHLHSPLDLQIVEADFIQDRKQVLFYFSGIYQVKALDTIRFLPGAIADHLTSAGGRLTDSGDQMSSLRWLEAGVTGSYGAVVEPCNFPAKFPHPGIVISRYMNGESLVEAYWKSVAWPGEGIFIGEPLASPYSHRLQKHRQTRQ